MTGVPARTGHALPQRRSGDLIRGDAAAAPGRRRQGEPRRQALEVAARRAELGPRHTAPAGADDLRLRRLRDRQHRVRRGALQGSLPAVGTRPTARLRDVAPAAVRPGTNWNYAHTNYVLLGKALEKATGEDMPKLLQEKVLARSG